MDFFFFLNLVLFNCMLWIGQFPKNLEANAEVVDHSQNSAVWVCVWYAQTQTKDFRVPQ